MSETSTLPEQPFKATDYAEIFEDAQETNFQLPDPGLEDAIETAFGDILITKAAQSDEITTLRYKKGDYPGNEIRAVNEKAYLELLRDFIDKGLAAAKAHSPQDVAYSWEGRGPSDETYEELIQYIENFKENMVYINNAEFEKSTDVMAERIIADAQAGTLVGVFSYIDRSPRYMCVKVLDKVRRLLESASNFTPEEATQIKENIIFSESEAQLASEVSKRKNDQNRPVQIYVVDDFVISGSRMSGGLKRVNRELIDQLPGADDVDVRGLVLCAAPEDDLAIDAVYQPKDGKARTTKEMAGSWSSTDYGFENKLSHIATRTGVDHPLTADNSSLLLAHMIKGRYEKDDSGQYLDPQYAEEYQKIVDTFGVKSS